MAASLRVLEADLYSIFDGLSDGVMVVSPLGTLLYRNAAAMNLPDQLQNHVLGLNGAYQCGCDKHQCIDPAHYSFMEGWSLTCHAFGENSAFIFRRNEQLADHVERAREEFSHQIAQGVPPSFAAMQVLRKFVKSKWISIGKIELPLRQISFDLAFEDEKIKTDILPVMAPDDKFDFCASIIATKEVSRCFANPQEAEALGIKHLIGVSLKNLKKECVGFALLADDHEPSDLRETMALLQEIVQLYGPYFEADSAQTEARVALVEANTDPVTGHGNRRACEGFLQECLDDMAFEQQGSEVLAMFDPNAMRNSILMLIDFDGFKRINDVMGHDEGDRALRLAADALAKINPDSRVFRLGGDEFVQIFPRAGNLESDDLRQTINLIERELDAAGFDDIGLSMGVVHFFEGDGSASSLMTLADARMYHDKHLRSVSFVELDL